MVAAHVLVFPLPAQGHMNSMLKLAELFSLTGLHVSFLCSDYNHQRFSQFSPAHARLCCRPGFRFLSIPDGLPDDDPRSASRLLALYESLTFKSKPFLRDLLLKCRQPSDGWPPVTCAVVDGGMPFAMDTAEEVGIPAILCRTSSACAFLSYYSIPNLSEAGEIPIPDGADLDERIRSVPGMEGFLRRRDLPSFVRRAKDIDDPQLQFVYGITASSTRARALILNTLETMEGSVLPHIRTICPSVYPIGPLHSLLQSYRAIADGVTVGPDSTDSASLWEEDRSCLTWLDAQPEGSVVYVSFGSFAVITQEDVLEFWHGLVGSGHRFLWVIRKDLVEGGAAAPPPQEVEEETRKRGCIVEWAPQQQVLAHPAVGCFLTHCGWNSTLESVVAGVPMLCWPFFADQQINSRFVSEVWRIGLDMKDSSGRGVVERMVKELMEGEKAMQLKRAAAAMAELATASVRPGGASFDSFEKLVRYIKSLSN